MHDIRLLLYVELHVVYPVGNQCGVFHFERTGIQYSFLLTSSFLLRV